MGKHGLAQSPQPYVRIQLAILKRARAALQANYHAHVGLQTSRADAGKILRRRVTTECPRAIGRSQDRDLALLCDGATAPATSGRTFHKL